MAESGKGPSKMTSKGKKEGKVPHKPKFPELPPKYSISRELRNKAEKMRRDRLNKCIEEMRDLVPMISNKSRKSDTTRTNILRLAANFLRLQNLFNNPKSSAPSPASFMQEGLSHLESMGGFLFMLLEDGRILYVSENVTKFIGYSQMEMMGWPIFNFTHPSDEAKLRSNLSRRKNKLHEKTDKSDKTSETISMSPSSSTSQASPSPSASQASPSNSSEPVNGHQDPKASGCRQSFYIRLKERPMSKNDPCQYEHIHVVGHFKRSPGSLAKDERLKAKLGDNMIMDDGEYVFVGIMRSVRDRPITELSLMEAIQDQYITRHLPDGRIIYSDHRIATIAGYLPSEVQGKSAFNFIYGEDLPWTTMAQRHMFASSNGEGDTTYRLLDRSGQLICLQSRGFLEFNKVTNKVESFMCINTLIRPEDMERCLAEQKERFTPYITEFQLNSISSDRDPSMEILPSLVATRTTSPPKSSSSLSSMACSPPYRSISRGPILGQVKMESLDEEKHHQWSNFSGKRKSSSDYEKSAKFSRISSENELYQTVGSSRISPENDMFPSVGSAVISPENKMYQSFGSSRLSTENEIYQTFGSSRNQLEVSKSPQNSLELSKSPQNCLSPCGEQYIAREEPAHRLEGGNRVVDVMFTENSTITSDGVISSPMNMFGSTSTTFSDHSLSFSPIDGQTGGGQQISTFNNMPVSGDMNGWTQQEQIPKDDPYFPVETDQLIKKMSPAPDSDEPSHLSTNHRQSVIKSSSNQLNVDEIKKKILLDLIRQKTPIGAPGLNSTSPSFQEDNNSLQNHGNGAENNSSIGYRAINNSSMEYTADNKSLNGYREDHNSGNGYRVDNNSTIGYRANSNPLQYNGDNFRSKTDNRKQQHSSSYDMEKSVLRFSIDNSSQFRGSASQNSTGYQNLDCYRKQKSHIESNLDHNMDSYQKQKSPLHSKAEMTPQGDKEGKILPNIDVSFDDFDVSKTVKQINKCS